MCNIIQINSLYKDCKQLFALWNDEFQFKLTEYIKLLKKLQQESIHHPLFIINPQINKEIIIEEHNNKLFYYSPSPLDTDIKLLDSLLNIKSNHATSLSLFNSFDSDFIDYNFITLGNALNIWGAGKNNIIHSMFDFEFNIESLVKTCNKFTEFSHLKRLIAFGGILLHYGIGYNSGSRLLEFRPIVTYLSGIIQSYFYVLPLVDVLNIVKHDAGFSKDILLKIDYINIAVSPTIKVMSFDKTLSMASKFVEITIPKLTVESTMRIAKEYND